MIKKVYYLYIIGFILFSLFSYLFIDGNFFYLDFLFTGIALHDRVLVSLVYLFFIIFFFLMYYFLIRDIKKVPELIKKNIFLTVFAMLVLLFSYPTMISYDIFNYAATAKVAFGYKENPYIVMPIELKNDSMLRFTQAANKIALYAPFWILIGALPYFLSLGNYLVLILLFKFVAVLAYFGCLYFIYKISKSYDAVVYFGLNPLILIETFVSAHNDTVMMFLALSSFWLLKKRKILMAGFILALSVLIKYSTIVLALPFVIVVINNFQKLKINWEKIYFYCFVLLFLIFILSPIREEIYPWYSIWPLSFLVLTRKKNLIYLYSFLCFLLMMRYIPYMLTGNNFGLTPIIKSSVTFVPTIIVAIYLLVNKKLLKNN